MDRARVILAALALAFVWSGCDSEQEPAQAPRPTPQPQVVEEAPVAAPVATANSLGGLRRRAAYDVDGFTVPPVEYWRTRLPDGAIAHVVAFDGSFLAVTVTGELHSIHQGTGAVGWIYSVGETVAASPVAAGDSVYVVDVVGRVHAVDGASGQAQWTTHVEGTVSVAPGVTRARIFVLSDSTFTVLDRESGAVESVTEVDSGRAFAVDRGVAYVAQGDGALLAVDPGDGARLWTAPADAPWRAGPVVLEEVLLLGLSDGRLVQLDIGTGEVVLAAEEDLNLAPNGLSVGQEVYAATVDGLVRAFSVDSLEPLWSYRGRSGFSGPPSVAGSVVYAVSHLGEIVALSAEDGVALFTHDAGLRAGAPPLPTDEGVLLQGEDGVLSFLAPGRGLEQAPVSRQASGDVVALPLGEPLTRPVPSDRDILLFSPPRNGTYQIVLADQESVEMIVDLYDADGVELSSNLDKVSLDSRLTQRLEAGREYVFEVYPVREGLVGRSYTIEVSTLR